MAEAGQAERGEARADGAGLARGWLENSPFVDHLGIRLEELQPGQAVLAMPYGEVSADDGAEVALALVTYQL